MSEKVHLLMASIKDKYGLEKKLIKIYRNRPSEEDQKQVEIEIRDVKNAVFPQDEYPEDAKIEYYLYPIAIVEN